MKCIKCNHSLPEDSEFCQYCGCCIEKVLESPEKETEVETALQVSADNNASEVSDVEELTKPYQETEFQLPDFGKMTPDEALKVIFQIQAQNTIKAMEANSWSQPNNEADADFGLVPEKPIFTLALKSVDGEKEYLEKLYTVNGEKIKYNRRGSTSVTGINGMIDSYDTYLPSGEPYKTIYINMYGAKRSTCAPSGFSFDARKKVICPKCKKVLPDDSEFCQLCGTKLSAEDSKRESASDGNSGQRLTQNQSEKYLAAQKEIDSIEASKKRKVLITAIIILAVIAIVVAFVAKDAKEDINNNQLRNFATEKMDDDYKNVYADVVSMEPMVFVPGTYSSGSEELKDRMICKCETVEGKTVWIIMNEDKYPGGSSYNKEEIEPQHYSKTDPVRLIGTVTSAEKVMYRLEKIIGNVFVLDVKELQGE